MLIEADKYFDVQEMLEPAETAAAYYYKLNGELVRCTQTATSGDTRTASVITADGKKKDVRFAALTHPRRPQLLASLCFVIASARR